MDKLQQKAKEIASTVQQEEQRLEAERHAIQADRAAMEAELKSKIAALEEGRAAMEAELKLTTAELKADLESRAAQLEEERAAFEVEKEVVAAANKVAKSKVKLDVGGTIYHASRTTLTSKPGSMLETMFSGRHELEVDEDGCVFIDRDGAAFKLVLECLRSPTSFSLDGLSTREVASCKAEFNHYGLPPVPLPVPPARPLSLWTAPNGLTCAQLQGDEKSCTIPRGYKAGGLSSWAIGAEVLANDAVWKTHVKEGPGCLLMGVIANPTPSCAHGDATFAGWHPSPSTFAAHGSNPGSPGWPGWQQNDEAIFKLNAAARTLTLHLKRTGQSYTFADLHAGKDGHWRFCISMYDPVVVVLSYPTDDERALVQ